MSTPNEYRQREADRQSGLHYQRISDRERFGEIQSIAQPEAPKPGGPLSIMQQQIAQMDLLLAELSAVRERALQAKAEGDRQIALEAQEASAPRLAEVPPAFVTAPLLPAPNR